MKKLLIGFAVAGLFAFTVTEENNGFATVNREQGIYLFVDSEPVREYEYLGVINSSSFNLNLTYVQVKKRLVKRVADRFPEGEAIILRFKKNGAGQADVIKFK